VLPLLLSKEQSLLSLGRQVVCLRMICGQDIGCDLGFDVVVPGVSMELFLLLRNNFGACKRPHL
jgi:hypothetical protein